MTLAGKLLQSQRIGTDAPAQVVSSLCERSLGRLGEGNSAEVMRSEDMQALKKSVLPGTMETRMMVTRPFQFGMTTLRWYDPGSDSVSLSALRDLVPRSEGTRLFHSGLESLIHMDVQAIPKDTMLLAGWDYACITKIPDHEVAEKYIAGRLAEFNDYPSRKIYAIALILMEMRERR